ncbi:TRADD-N-associated membrane domain-containing protein [Streptomyces parvus]|uniref:TRADD-N-associated membrane domain-containing protein n=1 Tax=Streptomyces parvus TaxID=66428 RepID=UPI0033F75447
MIRSGRSPQTATGTPDHENTGPTDAPGRRDHDGGDAARRSPLELAALWDATHARLDLYHQIATSQARTSFRNAQIAMSAGFLLLVLFAGIALWASSTVVAIVAGGLGAVSAALAGYVAKTFIRSQEAAATHLRSYFDQPLELSRYLAAERLVADGDLSREQRGEILTALVQAMVAGPQPPPAPQSVVVASVPGQQGA